MALDAQGAGIPGGLRSQERSRTVYIDPGPPPEHHQAFATMQDAVGLNAAYIPRPRMHDRLRGVNGPHVAEAGADHALLRAAFDFPGTPGEARPRGAQLGGRTILGRAAAGEPVRDQHVGPSAA